MTTNKDTQKKSFSHMLSDLANNHKLVREMNISGLKLNRRIKWLRDMFTEEEIEHQHGYITSENK